MKQELKSNRSMKLRAGSLKKQTSLINFATLIRKKDRGPKSIKSEMKKELTPQKFKES